MGRTARPPPWLAPPWRHEVKSPMCRESIRWGGVAQMARIGFRKDPLPIIALLTDFGSKDHYVGVMKGVIHGICRDAHVVDLSHNVSSQDITEAAFVLRSSYRYFPPGTVFVCVVDPGVGSRRAIVCLRANGQLFLAPDNGLLSVVASDSAPEGIYAVEDERFFLKPVSRTFQGRDIFAAVAAHLCAGVDPAELGPPLARVQALRLPRPVKTAGGTLRGEVIYIDHFGNLITNISDSILQTAFRGPRDRVEVSVKAHSIRGVSASYSEVEKGRLLALVGSSGYLEVAANEGSAAEMLGCRKGDRITLASAAG